MSLSEQPITEYNETMDDYFKNNERIKSSDTFKESDYGIEFDRSLEELNFNG